jgi:RNA polymerase sigma-70 factor (ECF subfamily)
MDRSDTALARDAAAGSSDAAGELFRRHWQEARRVARAVCGRHALADEVAQEAMVQAFAQIRRYRGEGPFGAWLRRIVVTRALDAMRAERRTTGLDALDGMAVEMPGTADPLLMRAVAGLPPEQRVVVALRFWLDLTPSEIAAATGMRVGTVGSRLARGLAALRSTLEVSDVERT